MALLNVWMNGELVGEWTASRSGTPVLRYAESWAASPRARALSLSLPLTVDREVRGPVVDHYFDNLLPDNPAVRRRIRDRFGLRSTEAFDLLEAIGRDCAGAVQLLPPDREPERWDRIDAERLSTAQAEAHLRAVTASPVFGAGADPGGNFRISIAGAQEKTALLYMGGAWHRPLNATPTTHILKLPLGIIGNFRGDFSHSVENEWLCAQFLRELGLPVAETQIAVFGEQRVLAVKRFDRRWMGVEPLAAQASGYVPAAGTWIARLPQEDFCQATGRPPTKRSENEGGPSANEILDILAHSESAALDRANFLIALLAFWLLAATDGHGKNFSIHLQAGGKFALTPLYDVLSAWPVVGHGANKLAVQDVKLAMAVSGRNRHYKLMEIQARHWHAAALRVGGAELWSRMKATVASAEAAMARIGAILPKRFPDIVITTIANGIRRQARQFAIGEPSL